MILIDAHQHYWDPAHGDYGWLEPGSQLDRRFLPEALAPALAAAGVTGTILVQAAPTLAETDRLLDLAERTPTVMGVVGWLDLDAPDAIAARIAERRRGLGRGRGLVGIRPMLQDLPDPDWILHPLRAPALAAIAASGLVFDALVGPAGIGAIVALARRHPSLAIVLDHAGKPPIGGAGMAAWRRDLAAAAACPNVSCKLSGLWTEAPAGTTAEAIVDLVRALVALWGPARLIWGSDWPVLTLAGDYAGWLAMARAGVVECSMEEKAAVFGGNAKRVYGL